MASPIFGADSRLDVDTLTVTTADAAFPKTNLFDDRIFTTYQNSPNASTVDIKTDKGSSGAVIDYFMMVGHDLFNPAQDGGGATTLTFAHSLDDISYTTVFSVTPTNNNIIARTFTTLSPAPRFLRARITRGSTFRVSVGQAQWGQRVEPGVGEQTGFDPNEERINARFSRSQIGNILGAVTSWVERRARFDIPLLESSFVDDATTGGFKDFWDNHASLMKPFLFHWNPGNPGSFEQDAFFGVINPDSGIARPLTTQLVSGFRTLRFEVVGLKE